MWCGLVLQPGRQPEGRQRAQVLWSLLVIISTEKPRTSAWLDSVGAIGKVVLDAANEVGAISLLVWQLTLRFFRGPVDRAEFWRNLHKMGVRSVGVVAVTSVFNGAILVVQAAPLVERFSATDIIGWAAGFGILRELGPLLISLMFSGRVGANTTAELGTMVATEQIDALRALAIDPLAYLILPRALAMVITLVALDIVGVTIALIGAVIASKVLLDVDHHQFISSFLAFLDVHDYMHGVIKSAIFGALIAVTSCSYGLRATGGAPGVGRAVTSAVVTAAVGIFVVDYFATFILR
jgi:phospholipid/cholesterol/gamma-HCH transport system permease protein